MLAQGWITHPQLQAALHAQKTSGNGRIGDWLISECGLEAEQVTRGLSVQWSCPVLTVHGFLPREMALVMPRQFVQEFGVVPLRVAGSRLLYLGWEDRLNASVAYAVEQMSGVKVESGLVEAADQRAARVRLMEAEPVPVATYAAEDEDALAAKITAVLEQKQPVAARLVRLHQYYWLRMWLESGTRGVVGNLPRSSEDMQDCVYTVGVRA
jgi:Type II secretion system (T2SS), protein E, N-terminal domain